MTDGLDAVREVATHWRRRYQAAQALLAETQRELDTAKDALFVVTSIKNRALDERDSFKFQRDELDKLFYRVVDQRADSRRWSAAWKRAAVRYRHGLRNIDPRIARLERITGGDPIQGVEDMYFTGESWQTEDE